MGTFSTHGVFYSLYKSWQKDKKSKKFKKLTKIWVLETVGTEGYSRILTGTFSKIQVLLDAYGTAL